MWKTRALRRTVSAAAGALLVLAVIPSDLAVSHVPDGDGRPETVSPLPDPVRPDPVRPGRVRPGPPRVPGGPVPMPEIRPIEPGPVPIPLVEPTPPGPVPMPRLHQPDPLLQLTPGPGRPPRR